MKSKFDPEPSALLSPVMLLNEINVTCLHLGVGKASSFLFA